MTAATALIAARMASSRLPGKTLMPILGKPMIERMVERIRRSSRIGQVVLATSDARDEDPLAAWAEGAGVRCFRGSPDDVLGRLRGAAETFDARLIVEILGDNPLVHAELIDACLDRFAKGDVDYVANVTNEYPKADPALKRFPIGVRIQVFTIDTLRRCEELAKTLENREHATSFIAQHPEIFRSAFVEAAGPWTTMHRPELTFAVNYGENLELIRRLFERCHPRDANFTLPAAIAAFDADPGLAALMGVPRG